MDVSFIKPFAARTYPKQVTASMGMDMRRYLLNGIFNEPNIRLLKTKGMPGVSLRIRHHKSSLDFRAWANRSI